MVVNGVSISFSLFPLLLYRGAFITLERIVSWLNVRFVDEVRNLGIIALGPKKRPAAAGILIFNKRM